MTGAWTTARSRCRKRTRGRAVTTGIGDSTALLLRSWDRISAVQWLKWSSDLVMLGKKGENACRCWLVVLVGACWWSWSSKDKDRQCGGADPVDTRRVGESSESETGARVQAVPLSVSRQRRSQRGRGGLPGLQAGGGGGGQLRWHRRRGQVAATLSSQRWRSALCLVGEDERGASMLRTVA